MSDHQRNIRRGTSPGRARSRLTIVLYCDCPVEKINPAYQFLRFYGYREVLVLAGGLAAWAARGYPLKR